MKKTQKYQVQVKKEHYDFNKYVNLARWITYFYQVSEVINIRSLADKNINILEIGIGNKISTSVLKGFGFNVRTMDIDPALKPDFVDSLPVLEQVNNKRFHCVLCCEVLEHIKPMDVGLALKNIAKITDYAVISVPNKGVSLSVIIKIWFLKHHSLFFASPTNFTKHKFNGEHYWELGGIGTSLRWFIEEIKNSGFIILKNYRLAECPDTRFLVLRKKE